MASESTRYLTSTSQESIGDRRTFFLIAHWWLPDQLLVVAGPFSIGQLGSMASLSHKESILVLPTKRLSKRYLLKQRGERAIALLL